MNCYKQILRIPWTQKVSNEEVLLRRGIASSSLLQNVKKLKLSYFGHIKRHDSLEKRILEAKVAGKRGRGGPSRRWEQDIQEWMGTTITQAGPSVYNDVGPISTRRRKVGSMAETENYFKKVYNFIKLNCDYCE